MDKTRINLANSQELLEIPGIDHTRRDVILLHRSQSGPIKEAIQGYVAALEQDNLAVPEERFETLVVAV